MDHMRWWKGGSDTINNNAEQVFDFPAYLADFLCPAKAGVVHSQ